MLDVEQFTPGAQSLHRGLMLLDVVGVMTRDETHGVGLADLARTTGLPKSSLHRLLLALKQAGYVEKLEPEGGYRLGVQAHVLGQLASSGTDPLHDTGQEALVRLAELSEDTTFLSVRQGSYGLCVRREEGGGVIRNNAMHVGDRHPLGIGAGSLAILASLPDADVETVFDRNAQVLSRQYPRIGPDTLRDLVSRTRIDGFATNPGLAAPGSWAIGVAVMDPWGTPAAALSIASIEQRLTGARQPDLVDAMHSEARFITASIKDSATANATASVDRGRPTRPTTTPPGRPSR